MIRVGDKFIIEIGESYSPDTIKEEANFEQRKAPTNLYRVKGFNSLVFDGSELNKLEKLDEKMYISSDTWSGSEKIDEIRKEIIKEVTEHVQSEIHEIMCKIYYEKQKQEFKREEECNIKLGDEVNCRSIKDDKQLTGIVVNIEDSMVDVINEKGETFKWNVSEIEATGRRFPQFEK